MALTYVRTPKITDVARMAGVSTATVSRALNRPDSVSEDTRKAVIEAATHSGYRVNAAAQNLRRGRSGAVIVLLPNLGNPFFSEILSGIEASLAQSGFSVLVADTTPQHEGNSPHLLFNYLHDGRADGIISLDGALNTLLESEQIVRSALPPIIYACEWSDEGNFPTVRVDNRTGAVMAVDHLAQLGHTDIGFVTGPEGNSLSRERISGFEEGMRANGLEIRPEWIFEGDFTMAKGEQAAASWLALDNRPTAIFCSSDETAFGLISGLHSKGVQVPQDVSVVGFDDIETAQFFIPPLTTIHQPRTSLGTEAAKLLMRCVENGPGKASTDSRVLPVELVVRKSTAVLKSPS